MASQRSKTIRLEANTRYRRELVNHRKVTPATGTRPCDLFYGYARFYGSFGGDGTDALVLPCQRIARGSGGYHSRIWRVCRQVRWRWCHGHFRRSGYGDTELSLRAQYPG